VMKVTWPHTIRDATEVLRLSHTTSHHSVKAPTSLEIARRRLSIVDTPIIILGVPEKRLTCAIVSSTTSFCTGHNIQGIIAFVIRVMVSNYLIALEKVDFDVMEDKI